MCAVHVCAVWFCVPHRGAAVQELDIGSRDKSVEVDEIWMHMCSLGLKFEVKVGWLLYEPKNREDFIKPIEPPKTAWKTCKRNGWRRGEAWVHNMSSS